MTIIEKDKCSEKNKEMDQGKKIGSAAEQGHAGVLKAVMLDINSNQGTTEESTRAKTQEWDTPARNSKKQS